MAQVGSVVRLWVLVALWLSAFASSASSAATLELSAVRLENAGGHLRANIELSASARFQVFTLDNPLRLVVDVYGAELRRASAPKGRGVVTGVRFGHPDSQRLRVVFDLAEPVRPKSYLLDRAGHHRHRLVVDLLPAHPVAAAFAGVAEAAAPVAAAPPRAVVRPAASGEARDVVIAIDAGHGGKDPGALGSGGTREKDITLQVARLLAERIDAEPGMRALLIRDSDVFLPLKQRYEKARAGKADLFISIHADAAVNRNARGSSVYMLSTRGATSEAARFLADRENRSDLLGEVSLDGKDQMLAAVLLDLSQGATLEASAQAAEYLLASLTRMGKAHKRYVERANFVVLRAPDVPSVLVETGFISNPEEEKKLRDPAHRARLADALLLGVRDYFHAAPPPGTWIAANAPKARSHVVARGETLSEIASRHGVSVTQIRRANALDSDLVRVGTVLKIPTAS